MLPTEIDHHIVAAVSISGSCLDVLGSLYLAYDLLGGQHGPLRVLTRAVTYAIVFGIGYGIGLGLFFGLVVGAMTGITISLEMNRLARGLGYYSMSWATVFSFLRGASLGAGLYPKVGLGFAAVFGLIISVSQVGGYARGIRPGMDYVASRRPHLSKRQFWGTAVRAVGYLSAALLCGFFFHSVEHPWSFAILVGMTTGIVTGVGQAITPYIEYYADNLPERGMGVFGVGLILCGFALQSVQYWLALFDVHLR